MAIKPHCVICGGMPDPAGSVCFANYSGDYQGPESHFPGWKNEIGVTAPPGVGVFCRRHLRRARRLRHLESREAVSRLAAPFSHVTLWRRLRRHPADIPDRDETPYWSRRP